MKVTPKVIDYAIHAIFLRHLVGVGSSLSLKIMAQDWQEAGLRKPDLGKGLEALRKAGRVALEQTTDGTVVRLLNEDFGLVVTLDDWSAAETLSKLRAARRRPMSHMASLAPKDATDRRTKPKTP
ncbi:MAG: hypothetical protein ACT4PG_02195 [Panacagrimonas sp.]